MFKPDWTKAPEWAKYLAMDDDGEWYWFEGKPFIPAGWRHWAVAPSYRAQRAGGITENWRESLEERP